MDWQLISTHYTFQFGVLNPEPERSVPISEPVRNIPSLEMFYQFPELYICLHRRI